MSPRKQRAARTKRQELKDSKQADECHQNHKADIEAEPDGAPSIGQELRQPGFVGQFVDGLELVFGSRASEHLEHLLQKLLNNNNLIKIKLLQITAKLKLHIF